MPSDLPTLLPARRTAVVLGAGVAGLLAARVLSDHVDEVVVVERDRLDTAGAVPRPGVPQAHHAHNLLSSGSRAMEALLPGLLAELLAAGAAEGGGAFFSVGGYLEAPADGGSLFASRALLESVLRARVLALPGVTLRDGVQAELPAPVEGRVREVPLRSADGGAARTLAADLVVDARGRGSRAVEWLTAAGWPAPEVERVEVGMRYASRRYRGSPAAAAALGGRSFLAVTPAPGRTRACGVLAQENGDWIVTLIGYFGDQPPLDEAGFAAFARGLPAPEPAALIAVAEPAGPIHGHAFAANVRRRFERMPRRPLGWLAIGDALAAFSPVYGQGMSVAALQAQALQAALARGGLDGVEDRFFAEAARAIDVPWLLAAGNDRQLAPGGPHGTRLQRWRAGWVRRVIRAGHGDPVVAGAFLRVARLLDPPTALLRPALVARVWRAT